MGNCMNKNSRSIRMVILGIGGSGKSTFTQQLQIINNSDTKLAEHSDYRTLLLQNSLYGSRDVSEYLLSDDHDLEVPKKARRAAQWLARDEVPLMDIESDEIWKYVKALSKHDVFWEAWEVRKKVNTQIGNLEYLIERLDGFLDTGYEVTNEDVLRVRIRTSGFNITSFKNEGWLFEAIDVGGQASERSKWKDIMRDGIDAIIFFIAADEYDVPGRRNPDETNFDEAMEVFSNIVNDEEFQDHLFVCFFNKYDLFKEKISTEEGYESFMKQFPDFKKKSKKYKFKKKLEPEQKKIKSCIKYLEDYCSEFLEEDRSIIYHPTTAIDRDKTSFIFESVKSKMILNKLEGNGLRV